MEIKKKGDWRVMEFLTPIMESVSMSEKGKQKFRIKGIAINETTTRNGITYYARELELAAPSFNGKPILLDHKNEIMSIVGRITNSEYDSKKKAITFEAEIMDLEIQKMINDGRVTDVSIGAKVADLVKNEKDNTVTAVGIEGLEISLVAVPGDKGANISLANSLANCLEIKESIECGEMENMNKEQPTEWKPLGKDELPDDVFALPVDEYPLEDLKKETIHPTKLFRYLCNKCLWGTTTTHYDIEKCPKCGSKDIVKTEIDEKGNPIQTYDEFMLENYPEEVDEIVIKINVEEER